MFLFIVPFLLCQLNHTCILCSSIIRDKIIPSAVSWFTGEAIETDDEDEDDHEEKAHGPQMVLRMWYPLI